jgi:hypothetical protein
VPNGPLRFWLLEETSDAKAVETIRASEILLRQCEGLGVALIEEARKPATEQQIKQIIGSRFALFPQPERTDAEWSAWWADYLSALDDLTPAAIEAGMAAWVRSIDAEFMPKPGKLRELAKTTPATSKWTRAWNRLSQATRKPDPVQPKELPRPEERPDPEVMRAQMQEFLTTMKAKDPFAHARAKAARPTPSAKLAEGRAMSAEMRAVLEAQREREANQPN